MNYFNYFDKSSYPVGTLGFPEEKYLEYPRGDFKSDGKNDVYRMIRESFVILGLDKENVGTSKWNPLGKYIESGNTVLIKPNLVMHQNPSEEDRQKGLECLVTHPSVTRCIFDYVYIALQGKGRIIIADAPVQDCDFEKLLSNSGYDKLFEYIKTLETETLKIEIEDLRETKMEKNGNRHRQMKREDLRFKGRVVDIKSHSNFQSVAQKNKLRITNYHGRDTVKYHSEGRNEYCISEAALQADVIINLVKPKTHRIAGYTAALKNMIGINTAKEYLPHHRRGSIKHGGDEFQHSHMMLKTINNLGNEVKNWAMKYNLNLITDIFNAICRSTGIKLDSLEKNRKKFGAWYGNDTIWRTIMDVNYIVKYCDKNGVLQDKAQRKLLHIGDMIVCGDKEGPMMPSYKPVGGILVSDNAVEFDACVVRLMGFDYKKIPTLRNAIEDERLYAGKVENIYMHSNQEKFSGYLHEIKDDFQFCPTSGWEEVLRS